MGGTSHSTSRRHLEDIGEAVLAAIGYRRHPLTALTASWSSSTRSRTRPPGPGARSTWKSAGSNYVLFSFPTLPYNSAKSGQLVLSEDVPKWLGERLEEFPETRQGLPGDALRRVPISLRKYYPGAGSFVNQLENVNLIKDDFTLSAESTAPSGNWSASNSTQEILIWP